MDMTLYTQALGSGLIVIGALLIIGVIVAIGLVIWDECKPTTERRWSMDERGSMA